jgi:hypothetical protein
MSSRGLYRLLRVLRPCGRLVVGGSGFQAAMQDSDEPVGELAQRGAVADAAGALMVVIGAGAVRRGENFDADVQVPAAEYQADWPIGRLEWRTRRRQRSLAASWDSEVSIRARA